MDTKSSEGLDRSLYEKLEKTGETNVQAMHTMTTRRIELPISDAGREIVCIVVGDDNTGKSTLIATLANLPPPIPQQEGWGLMHTNVGQHTIEVVIENGKNKLLRLLPKKMVLSVFNTIGDEAYDRLRPLFYPRGHVFLLCFSIANPVSFESVKEKWYYETSSYANISDHTWVLLGLHADERKSEHKSSKELDGGRDFVSRKEAEQLAKDLGRLSKKKIPYVECDAREEGELQAVFEAMAIASTSKPGKKLCHKPAVRCTIL